MMGIADVNDAMYIFRDALRSRLTWIFLIAMNKP